MNRLVVATVRAVAVPVAFSAKPQRWTVVVLPWGSHHMYRPRARSGCAGFSLPLARSIANESYQERAVIDQLRVLLQSPEIIVATWREARKEIAGLTEAEVRDALQRLDPLWDELFPAEQARIVQLLVERVDVRVDGIDVRLRVDGLLPNAPSR